MIIEVPEGPEGPRGINKVLGQVGVVDPVAWGWTGGDREGVEVGMSFNKDKVVGAKELEMVEEEA